MQYIFTLSIFDSTQNQKNQLEEKLLIEGLKQQNKFIFDYLFQHYYSGLCAFSMKYIDDKQTVEDLVQDFFLFVWFEGKALKITDSLRAYFFTSVKNKCLDYIKHEKVKNSYKKQIINSNNLQDDGNASFYIESELKKAIEEGLKKLAPRCKEIFELSRFQGKTNAEIAESLNISKRTVELQISNALKTLRFELKEFLPVFLTLFI